MISGRETLESIDQAIQGVRGQIKELDDRIQGTSTEWLHLNQAESEQYKALARIRVGQLAAGNIVRSLDQVEQGVGELLSSRQRTLDELQQKADNLQGRQSALESERKAQSERVGKAAKALDEAEAVAQVHLKKDAAYQAQLERSQQADQTAKRAEKKIDLAEQDRVNKGKPYEQDRLFMYLWERGYGTLRYQANPLIRFFDGRVAKLCGYYDASKNYAMLLEIPKRLREHAEELRKQADTEFESLKALEQAATSAGGVVPLREALAVEQSRIDTLDKEIEQLEQQFQGLLQERAVFAAGEDEAFRQAVERMTAELHNDDIASLRREVQLTPLPDDDVIVDRLAALEQDKNRLQEALNRHKEVLRGQQNRLQELESLRRDFKRQRYDEVYSGFADGALVGVLLNEFLRGLTSRDDLWREIQNQQRRSQTRSDPTFGSGGFRGDGSVWHRGGGWGGGFRTGGSFGRGGGGFRTGGGF